MTRYRRIFALLLWSLWTLVVIPCHTRGAIPLGQSVPQKSCCCDKTASVPAGGEKKSHAPEPCNCAICHLTSLMTTPPAAPVFSSDLAPAAFSIPLAIGHLASNTHPRIIACRGPPAC